MKLNSDTSIERLKSLINKDVYVDVKEGDGIYTLYFKLISINDNKVTFKTIDHNEYEQIYNINDIYAIDELKNYNEREFDLNSLRNKEIELTDMNNNTEVVIITEYDERSVYLTFTYEMNNGELGITEDYEFPICFIKDIKIVK